MEKYFVYFGTEENGYEVEKSDAFKTMDKAVEDVKEYVTIECNPFNSERVNEELKPSIDTIVKELNTNGYGYEYLENVHGYTIILGIAKNGYCKNLRKVFTENRQEIANLFA